MVRPRASSLVDHRAIVREAPGGHHHPPPLPILLALDVNHDGVIDSNEIANAPAELLTLDKNHDGQLTRDEYLPHAPKAARVVEINRTANVLLLRPTTTKSTAKRARLLAGARACPTTTGINMKPLLTFLLTVVLGTSTFADPQLTSWATTNSAQYARIRATTGATPVTTWTGQTLPVYSDVQTIMYSTNNVYVYAPGLASYIMGPWYLNAAKTMIFPNKPTNQKVTMRFPRVQTPATSTHTSTPGGAMGMYVNGVAMFNMLDGYAYNATSGTDQQGMIGSGIWERDAAFAELPTFDPANAHQPGSGQYHMHINPIGLRYQLNDNATYTAASDTYSESTNSLRHSPILAWAFDGYPGLRSVRLFRGYEPRLRHSPPDLRLYQTRRLVWHVEPQRHGPNDVALLGATGAGPHEPHFFAIRPQHDEDRGHDRLLRVGPLC